MKKRYYPVIGLGVLVFGIGMYGLKQMGQRYLPKSTVFRDFNQDGSRDIIIRGADDSIDIYILGEIEDIQVYVKEILNFIH